MVEMLEEIVKTKNVDKFLNELKEHSSESKEFKPVRYFHNVREVYGYGALKPSVTEIEKNLDEKGTLISSFYFKSTEIGKDCKIYENLRLYALEDGKFLLAKFYELSDYYYEHGFSDEISEGGERLAEKIFITPETAEKEVSDFLEKSLKSDVKKDYVNIRVFLLP